MQLILLSGGSGKRLWPLSNNARSKQFLPLLEEEDGGMESMAQRVVSQVRLTNLTYDITLATNVSQAGYYRQPTWRFGKTLLPTPKDVTPFLLSPVERAERLSDQHNNTY